MSADLARVEAIVDASGVPDQVEALLPAGVRRRQLTVRTLLIGIILTTGDGRPAHLTCVHQTLRALPEADQRRLAVIAPGPSGEHPLTYRQLEYTFALIAGACGQQAGKLTKQPPDGTPSPQLSHVLDALLEASIQVLAAPASTSYTVDWTDQPTWSCPQTKPTPDAEESQLIADDANAPADAAPPPDHPTDDADDPPADRPRRTDRDAAWGHRRGHAPGQTHESFYGYYLQAITIVKVRCF